MNIVNIKRGSWGKIVAFFDIETAEGFTIKGFKLVDGADGKFVGFPSQKKDEEYYDTVWADKELKAEIHKKALTGYESATDRQEDNEFEPVPAEDIPF